MAASGPPDRPATPARRHPSGLTLCRFPEALSEMLEELMPNR
jgi:hypothetical protein